MQIKGINIEFLGHSGFLISSESKRIAIDPYNISDNIPKADLILVTHSHYDHCSIKDIEKIKKDRTVIVIPADAQSKITKIKDVEMQIIEPGDELKIGNTKIEAIPAYNTNKDFHPKREGWLGYLIKLKEIIIYHAGDSDKIPEMKNLTGYGKHGNEFIALLPVSGKYVMDAEEAAEVASFLSPTIAIPMHYGAGVAGTTEDAEKFVKLCKEKGLKAEVLEKI
ncbi:MAG: MBL fold metallo-hydrolase [Nanoarchaeota archaeon]|nr:MBL fold metallo-hydrolase [Nanoarchaeota archaeon]MBU1102952.1 MBL fold metallo-hydrolase [Nanoarchaeota archaeon]